MIKANNIKGYNSSVVAFVLAILAALQPLCIDLYLPAFSEIATALNTNMGNIQISLSVFLGGFALGQLLWGPLSDYFGRKAPILISVMVFVISSFALMWVTNIGQLWTLRFIQAFGGAAGAVIGRAMVNELFEEKKRTEIFSLLVIIAGVAPVISPTIGNLLMKIGSWQAIFMSMGILGVISLFLVRVYLPESKTIKTNNDSNRSVFSFKNIIIGYIRVAKNRQYIKYTLISSMALAGLMVYVSNAPFLIMEQGGFSSDIFALIFAINGIGLILVDVNLYETDKGDYIEIVVEPYPYPVNYKGQYHYRSGSTKQEMKGAALDKFMLQKKGKRWDGVPVPNVAVSDLKQETIDFFKKRGIKSQRISEDVLTDTNEHLLENLQLTENDYLKRAAILLFYPNPEKFVTGAYIKIGYFKTDVDLIFQDEVHGNLFEQIEKTMDLLFTKYIKAIISYEGINRIETFEYPKDAVREALLNSVAHKHYADGVPIQISVYDDKIIIWNEGQLPENWTVENLLKKHPSKPYNPDIANALFRSGYIESWGRGTLNMINECLAAGLPAPCYFYDMSGFWVEFRKDIYNEEYLKSIHLNERQIKAVLYTKDKKRINNIEYRAINNVSKATATRDLAELVDKHILKMLSGSTATFYELV